MLSCGRIRKPIDSGLTHLIGDELDLLKVSIAKLSRGDRWTIQADGRERAIVIVRGTCTVTWEKEQFVLGPRRNPFDDKPHAVFIRRGLEIHLGADDDSLVAIGSAPASKEGRSSKVRPEDVRVVSRGRGNWSRTVRMVCWSDNTQGEMLLAGETCTPSGNWSTIPPHRHQQMIPGEEVPYEEAYFFQFSRPEGFGLTWQFDDEKTVDQSFSLRNDDLLYMNGGYHPVVCGPGSTLYHLSFMAGPQRISQANVHPDYRHLLEDHNLQNQYTPETK